MGAGAGSAVPAHKNQLHAELIRVPLVVSWPGVVEPRHIEENVSLVDLLPTIEALTGGEQLRVLGSVD